MKATFKLSMSLSGKVTLREVLDPSPGQLSLLFKEEAGRSSRGVCELGGEHRGPTLLAIKEHSGVLCDGRTSCAALSPAGGAKGEDPHHHRGPHHSGLAV